MSLSAFDVTAPADLTPMAVFELVPTVAPPPPSTPAGEQREWRSVVPNAVPLPPTPPSPLPNSHSTSSPSLLRLATLNMLSDTFPAVVELAIQSARRLDAYTSRRGYPTSDEGGGDGDAAKKKEENDNVASATMLKNAAAAPPTCTPPAEPPSSSSASASVQLGDCQQEQRCRPFAELGADVLCLNECSVNMLARLCGLQRKEREGAGGAFHVNASDGGVMGAAGFRFAVFWPIRAADVARRDAAVASSLSSSSAADRTSACDDPSQQPASKCRSSSSLVDAVNAVAPRVGASTHAHGCVVLSKHPIVGAWRGETGYEGREVFVMVDGAHPLPPLPPSNLSSNHTSASDATPPPRCFLVCSRHTNPFAKPHKKALRREQMAQTAAHCRAFRVRLANATEFPPPFAILGDLNFYDKNEDANIVGNRLVDAFAATNEHHYDVTTPPSQRQCEKEGRGAGEGAAAAATDGSLPSSSSSTDGSPAKRLGFFKRNGISFKRQEEQPPPPPPLAVAVTAPSVATSAPTIAAAEEGIRSVPPPTLTPPIDAFFTFDALRNMMIRRYVPSCADVSPTRPARRLRLDRILLSQEHYYYYADDASKSIASPPAAAAATTADPSSPSSGVAAATAPHPHPHIRRTRTCTPSPLSLRYAFASQQSLWATRPIGPELSLSDHYGIAVDLWLLPVEVADGRGGGSDIGDINMKEEISHPLDPSLNPPVSYPGLAPITARARMANNHSAPGGASQQFDDEYEEEGDATAASPASPPPPPPQQQQKVGFFKKSMNAARMATNVATVHIPWMVGRLVGEGGGGALPSVMDTNGFRENEFDL